MAYQFAGFFARPGLAPPDDLPAGSIWREISAPFAGVGLRLPDEFDHDLGVPSIVEVNSLAERFGFARTENWVYLTYVCWGGAIDFVHGCGSRKGRSFGPIEESARDKVEAAYTGLMGEFGVSLEDALRFPPFVRGFWGDV